MYLAYHEETKDAAQQRIWTFYEAININSYDERCDAVKTKKYIQPFNWIVVAAAIILTAGCGEEIPPGTTPSKTPAVVKTATSIIELIEQPEFYEASGTVFARTAATVSAKVMGEIRKVLVQEGDTVAAGDILVVIDDSQLSARLQQAEAALAEANQGAFAAQAAFESARASSELAEKTLRRYEMLIENESVSRQEFDEVKSRYNQAAGGLSQAKSMRDAAQNRIEQAQAGLLAAKSSYDDTTVTAPYDAVVTGRLADKGDLASPGVPLIQLETIGSSEVHMVLPETHIRQVKVGDKLPVYIPSIQKEALSGEIKTINSAANPATRSFQVKVSLPDVPAIQVGMFARVLIPIGQSEMILVPETAVIAHGQLSGVYVVDADHIARFRLIRPGRFFGSQVEVLSGLKNGDRFIINPGQTVVDGIKVEEI